MDGQKQDFPTGIPECGADALRFGLLAYTVQGRDVNLDIQRVVGYRQFCNKIWNATKFALTYVSDYHPSPSTATGITSMPGVSPRDRAVLHSFNQCIEETDINMKAYVFGNVTSCLHSFFLYDFCDVYLELSKPVFLDTSPEGAAAREAAQATLYTILEQYLRLAHPIMPFVTEELWQRLPNRAGLNSAPSIMVASYPLPETSWTNAAAAADMTLIKNVIGGGRSLRSDYRIDKKEKIDFYYRCSDTAVSAVLDRQADDFCTLAKANFLKPEPAEGAPTGCCVKVVSDSVALLVNLTGIIDIEKEIARLTKDLDRLNPVVESLEKKMEAPGYEEKVPEAVRKQSSEKLQATKQEISTVERAIKDFKSMQ